jgi:adenine phosphoribosyltransferase
VLPIRKAGKLPPPVLTRGYTLEYGTADLEIPADGITVTDKRVLLVDDVLATGGTLAAAADLLGDAGARVEATAAVLELTALHGRDQLASHRLTALLAL